jgi:cysteine desulfuration protein SufE
MVHLFDSCKEKQERVKQLFSGAESPEEKYQVLIDLGKEQPRLSSEEKTEAARVHGCQSRTYLKTVYENGLLYLYAESDALISAGLAQLITLVYSGEPPEVILRCPLTYLEELGMKASLSPGRANGLASILLRVRQEAAKQLLPSNEP